MLNMRPVVGLSAFWALLGTNTLLGQTAVWIGGGSDQNFTTAGNWQGGVVPNNSGAYSAQFQTVGYNYSPIYINTASNLSGLVFSSTVGYPYYDFFPSSGGTLTIGSGGISASPGGYAGVYINVPVTLSASQTWGVPSGYIDYDGNGTGISETGGSQSLTTNGTVYMYATNTFSGGVTVATGTFYAGTSSAAGTGPLTLLNGTSLYAWSSSVNLLNSISLGNNVTIGSDGESGFTLSGPITVANQATTLNLGSDTTVAVSGSITGTASQPLNLTISGSNSMLPNDGGSMLVMEGTLSNVGTVTISDGYLILAPAPASLATAFASITPTGLQVGTSGTAYLGLDGAFTTSGAVSNFLTTYGAGIGASINGTLGFDSFANPSTPNVFNDPINLTNFTSTSFLGLGSATAAILGSAAMITPPSNKPNTYIFGGGGGTLTVQSALTDDDGPPRNLVMTTAPEPVTVILQSAGNTYSGGTTSYGGVLIFDSPTPTGSISLEGGYVGYTSKATNITSAQTFVNLFSTSADNGVIGFDTTRGDTTLGPINDPIDLSGFSGSGPFLGTSTALTLQGAITPTGTTYQFTGVKGGALTVNSTLAGGNSVVVGLPVPIEANGSISSVTLGGPNTYTGGTTLNSGILYVNSAQSLGTGTMTVNGGSLLPSAAAVSLANLIVLNSSLDLGQYESPNLLSLNGVISGSGGLNINGNVVLNGVNTFLGGVFVENANVTLGSSSALGAGSVYLGYEASLTESSPNPTVTDLVSYESGSEGSTINLAPSSTLTVYADTNQFEYYWGGNINGDSATSLIKTGPGIEFFIGTSTYGGGTTVSAGTLLVGSSSALGTGTVAVLNGAELDVNSSTALSNNLSLASGSILGGTGTYSASGGVTVSGGAIVAPGYQSEGYYIGALSFSNLTLGSGGIFAFNIQNAGGVAGTDYSTLNASGTLTISATPATPFQINLTSIDPSTSAPGLATFNSNQAYSWTLVTAGTISGFNSLDFSVNTSGFQNPLNGGSFLVSENGNALDLNFTPVPEPSTLILMLAGMAAISARIRSSKRR
jgi:autotransporter-associated beta strand protein